MFNEMHRLREDVHLLRLLSHYVEATGEDREAWLDRLMLLEGVEPRDLSKLHGELIAHGWIEQNTGAVPVLRLAACPASYRTTGTGRRAIVRNRKQLDDDDAEAA